MTYQGPTRLNKELRRVGETKAFANKRKKSRERSKAARKARKRS